MRNLIYAPCAVNNVVRFRSLLMVAAGALITTKYGPISAPGFEVSSRPAYCRRGARWRALANLSFTNRRIRSYRISAASPWRWPICVLCIERETRFPRTTKLDRTGISDELFIARWLCREKSLLFLSSDLYGRWTRQSKKEISFTELIEPRLIGPSKNSLTPCGCIRSKLQPNGTR